MQFTDINKMKTTLPVMGKNWRKFLQAVQLPTVIVTCMSRKIPVCLARLGLALRSGSIVAYEVYPRRDYC